MREKTLEERRRRYAMSVYTLNGGGWTWDARGGAVSAGSSWETEEAAIRDFDIWAENAEHFGR